MHAAAPCICAVQCSGGCVSERGAPEVAHRSCAVRCVHACIPRCDVRAYPACRVFVGEDEKPFNPALCLFRGDPKLLMHLPARIPYIGSMVGNCSARLCLQFSEEGRTCKGGQLQRTWAQDGHIRAGRTAGAVHVHKPKQAAPSPVPHRPPPPPGPGCRPRRCVLVLFALANDTRYDTF